MTICRQVAGAAAAMTIALAPAAASQEWVAAGARNGVALAYRDAPRLGAREVRAIADMPHSAERIIAVVCDFTQRLDPDVREARILTGNVNTRYSVYLRYAPRYVVVAARDVVIDVRREPDGCAWSEQPDQAHTHAGTVRMPLLRGSWSVVPLDATRARVTYQIAVDPGGRIPGWLVRRGAARALPRVIERVGRCLEDAAGRTRAEPPRCG